MPKHTDHGLVVLEERPDGTTAIDICTKVVDGSAQNVFAHYEAAAQVEVARSVHLTKHGNKRASTEIVDVYETNGVVVIAQPSRSLT